MKNSRFTARCRATLVVAAMLSTPQLASAIQMSVYVMTPSQWGTGSSFYLGHTVTASTPYNVLNAGGSYTVQCNHPATIPMTGERQLSSTTYGFDRNMLVVTIPAQQPARQNISGWLQIPNNTTLSCNYRWIGYATEGGYSIGAGGISYQVGNGTMREGGTVNFTLFRPSKEDADGGCTP